MSAHLKVSLPWAASLVATALICFSVRFKSCDPHDLSDHPASGRDPRMLAASFDGSMAAATTITSNSSSSSRSGASGAPAHAEHAEPRMPLYLPCQIWPRPCKFAYVFYVAHPNYHCAALVNARRLADLGKDPSIDVVFMVPPGSDLGLEGMRQRARELHIIYKEVPELPLGSFTRRELANQAGYYRTCMLKLHAFNLTNYDRVLFMDADQLVMKNMDHLFTQLLPVDVAAPRSYWLLPGQFPNGYRSEGWAPGDGPEVGPQMKFGTYWMMIMPSERMWRRLYDKYYPGGKPNFTDMFDMDLLNIEFKDDVALLPGAQLVVASTDFLKPNMDHRPPNMRPTSSLTEWFHSSHVLHFFAPGKVWTWDAAQFNKSYEGALDVLKGTWTLWWSIRNAVC